MAQIQRTIFLFCIATATVYAASIPNLSEDYFSAEIEESASPTYESNVEKTLGQITEYETISPSYILSEQSTSDGFQMGKSLIQALLGVLPILRQIDLSQAGLKNVSLLVARMVSMFLGQYYETLKKMIPVFSGMAIAFLETLR